MASRSKFVINGEVFTTKKSLEQRIQAILHRGIVTKDISESEQSFILGVLSYHNQADSKIGCGVAKITVRRNPQGSYGFWITRVDGTETDFSYKSCLTRPTKRTEALKGFRQAVLGQIFAFRDSAFTSGTAICAILGIPVTRDEADVDHEWPCTFLTLVEKFLHLNGLSFDDVEVCPTEDGSTYTYLADGALEKDWQEFHKQHAKLRIVCKKAHRALGRGRAA